MLTMFAEIRLGGKWHKVGEVFESTFEDLDVTDRVYDGRNKYLINFLIESNKQNHPDNFSEEVNAYMTDRDGWYCATLEELLNYLWDKETCKTGYISEWQYERL